MRCDILFIPSRTIRMRTLRNFTPLSNKIENSLYLPRKFLYMQEIIEPIDRDLIEQELTDKLFIRPTNNGGNQLYIINCHNAPNTLKEIGRLRELSFRTAGGGTGKDCDLDEFDFGKSAYQQL